MSQDRFAELQEELAGRAVLTAHSGGLHSHIELVGVEEDGLLHVRGSVPIGLDWRGSPDDVRIGHFDGMTQLADASGVQETLQVPIN